MFLAVDNLPTEFPKEATQYFGDSLLPFLEPVVLLSLLLILIFIFKLKSDIKKPYEQQTDLPPEVYKAVVATHNQLTPKYRYIMDLRKENEKR
jgi:alpha-aminoadipic semialdehyde synthase